jgi:uncharacterized membrane protein (DUF106 family)
MGMIETWLHPLGVALDPILAPITAPLPSYITLSLMAVFLTALIMGVSRLFVNKDLLRQVKEQMEDVKERLSKAQKSGDKKLQESLLDELMKANGRYMSQMIKIMIISIVIFFIFFPWMSYKYAHVDESGVIVNEIVVKLPFTLPFINIASLDWFWWYFVSGFAAGTAMRKIMGSDI